MFLVCKKQSRPMQGKIPTRTASLPITWIPLCITKLLLLILILTQIQAFAKHSNNIFNLIEDILSLIYITS